MTPIQRLFRPFRLYPHRPIIDPEIVLLALAAVAVCAVVVFSALS